MTVEQMKESLKTIKLLEKDLLRDLTEEEKEIVVNKGWEEFLFNHLGFTPEDFAELKAIKSIISAFYTQNEDVFKEAVSNAPEGTYFVLRDIVKAMEDAEPVEGATPEKHEEDKEDNVVVDYIKFMQDLYKSLPKGETPWFNELTEDLHKQLLDVYRAHRNDTQNVSDNLLGGIMTDAVKDAVIENMVSRLKNKESVKMTNDEYMEIADYLAEHEDKFFLSNENGEVTLKVF